MARRIWSFYWNHKYQRPINRIREESREAPWKNILLWWIQRAFGRLWNSFWRKIPFLKSISYRSKPTCIQKVNPPCGLWGICYTHFTPGIPANGRYTRGYARFDPPRRILTLYNFDANRLFKIFAESNWNCFWIEFAVVDWSAVADPTLYSRGCIRRGGMNNRLVYTIRNSGSNHLHNFGNSIASLVAQLKFAQIWWDLFFSF